MSTYRNQIDALAILLQSNHPFNVIGEPGIGKTAIIRAVAKALEYVTRTITLATRSPEDVGGFGRVTDNGVEMVPPAWAREFSKARFGERHGLVFFDEGNQAPRLMQAACMRVILEGVVGDEELGPNVRRGFAMNPTEISAGGYDLAGPLANRFCHLYWKRDIDEWRKGLMLGFPAPTFIRVPDDWRKRLPEVNAMIAAFSTTRPTAIYNMPTTEDGRSGPWPSDRTWTMAGEVIAAATAAGANDDVKGMLLAGYVGESSALEYFTYLRNMDLQDVEELLKDPSKLRMPDRADRMYALMSSIVSTVFANLTPKRWETAMLLTCTIGKQTPDIAAAFIKLLMEQRPKGQKTSVPDDIQIFAPMMRKAGLL